MLSVTQSNVFTMQLAASRRVLVSKITFRQMVEHHLRLRQRHFAVGTVGSVLLYRSSFVLILFIILARLLVPSIVVVDHEVLCNSFVRGNLSRPRIFQKTECVLEVSHELLAVLGAACHASCPALGLVVFHHLVFLRQSFL